MISQLIPVISNPHPQPSFVLLMSHTQKIRLQLEAYFHPDCLRFDRFLTSRLKDPQNPLKITEVLEFPELKKISCRYPRQVRQALQGSHLLKVNESRDALIFLGELPTDRQAYQDMRDRTCVICRALPCLNLKHLKQVSASCGALTRIRKKTGLIYLTFGETQEMLTFVETFKGTWPADFPVPYRNPRTCLLEIQPLKVFTRIRKRENRKGHLEKKRRRPVNP